MTLSMFSIIKNESMGIVDYQVLSVCSFIKNKSIGIEDYQIVLMVSLIRNESMGIECNQILLLFSLIKNESMGINVFNNQERKYGSIEGNQLLLYFIPTQNGRAMLLLFSTVCEESKSLCSGGSMVTRLNLNTNQ